MKQTSHAHEFNRLGWLYRPRFAGRRIAGSVRSSVTRPAGFAALVLTALAGGAILFPVESPAALMAYEGFKYSTGNLTGQSGGFGWNGVWQTVNNGSSTVVTGSLTAGANAPSGYDSHSVGNAVFTPNGTRAGRFLDTSTGGIFGQKGYLNGSGNVGAAGKTIYISFMQQPNIANNNYYEFEFHRGNLSDPGRVGGVGCDTGGSSSVYLRTPSINQNPIGAASTSVSFYVVRIDFMGGNDTVTVYQNPTSATEPATPTLVETGAGDMSFNGLSFGAFVNGATVAHDEIRVGETWADVVSPGAASTGQWVGGGANNNWSTGGNWDNGVVPVFATSLDFTGSLGLSNTNDLSGVSANSITFDAAAGAFNVNGNSLGLNGNIGFSANPVSAITQTINLSLVPTVNLTVDTPANGNLALNGNITSGNSLTKVDSGTLTLGGTNTFSALSGSGGTNIITGNTAFTGGGNFYLADGDFINGCQDTLILQPGSVLSVTGSYGDAGVLGRDSGSATVIQNGGTFSFNPANQTYLFVGASGSPATRSEYDMKGGVLDLTGKTLGIALGANTVITGVVNQVGGVITNVGNLLFSPFFTQGYGIYNLTGGTIYIGSGGITVFSGASYELNLGGGTIAAGASWSSALNMRLTGNNGPVNFNPAGNTITLTGVLSGSGGLSVAGGGILEMSGANTYTGDTTVNSGGTLQLDATGSSAGAFRVANGGTLNLNYSGMYVVGSLYTNGVALPIGTYNSGNLPAFITGSGSLQVASGISTGLWTGLGANNNWSTAGNWDNNAVPVFPHALTFAGNSQLNNNNDLSGIAISSLTFSNTAGAFTLNGNDITLGSIGFSGNPPAPITQTVNLNLAWNSDQTIDTPVNGSLSLGGNITAAANQLTKTDAGALTLGGTDTFASYILNGGTNIITGNVTINGTGSSVIYFGNAGTNSGGTMIIQPGAALTVNGSFSDAMVIGRNGGSGTVIQNGGTFSYNNSAHSYLFVGATSEAGTRAEYDMNGGGLNLNGETLGIALGDAGVVYTAVLNQTGGAISNVFDLDLGAVRAFGHGVYNLSGGSITIDIGGITCDSGSYAINLGGGTIAASSSWSSTLNMTLTGSNGPATFNTSGNTITLSGVLSGPGGLDVTGGGILVLSGANSYLGDTMVSSGILQLNNTGSSLGAFRVVDGGLFNLNYSGNYVVAALYTNGVSLPQGTYNSGNLPSYISGSGNIQVVHNISTGLWEGLGADNNWSTAGNWDSDAVPVFPIALTFAGNARLNNNNDLTGITVSSITFSNTAGAFTLGGNPIALSGKIGFSSNPSTTVTQTVNLAMTWPGAETIDTPANGNLSLGGNITASSDTSLTKVDNGTLTLGGVNSILSWDLNGGTTIITGNTTLNGGGNSRMYVGDGDAQANCNGTLIIQPGAAVTMTGSFADAFVIGRDSGSGKLVQNGGTFTFNPNVAYLFVGASDSPVTRAEYDMNGGVLDMNGKTLGLALGVNVLITGVVNQVSGVITNVGQVFLDSFFTAGHSIYNLSGGSLYLGSGGIVVQSGGSYELNFGGGTLGAEANWSSSLNMNLTGLNGSLTFDTGTTNTISLSGVLSGSGGLTVEGTGILELAALNIFTGDTMINSGSTLKLDLPGYSLGTVRAANGAVLNLNYSGTNVFTALYTNGVAVANGVYTAANLPGLISGTGSVKVGNLPTSPTNLAFSAGGGNLHISWPANYQGWILQVQTNALSKGLGANWTDVAGSANGTSATIPINATTPTAFYRLRYPSP